MIHEIDDGQLAPIISETDLTVIWGKPRDLYAKSSTAHADSLHLELHECQVNNQETENEHGNRLAEIKSELASIGKPLFDKIIISSVICGLREYF